MFPGFPQETTKCLWLTAKVIATQTTPRWGFNRNPSHVFLPSPSRLALTVAIHKPFEGDIPPYATTVISTFFMHEGDGYRERVCCVMHSRGAVVPRPHSRAG